MKDPDWGGWFKVKPHLPIKSVEDNGCEHLFMPAVFDYCSHEGAGMYLCRALLTQGRCPL